MFSHSIRVQLVGSPIVTRLGHRWGIFILCISEWSASVTNFADSSLLQRHWSARSCKSRPTRLPNLRSRALSSTELLAW